MTVEERNRALTLRGFEEMFDEGDHHRGSVVLTAVRGALLMVGGLLTGAIFDVWLMEHSFRGDGSLYTELKQLQIRALQGPLPLLGAATLAFGLVHLFLARRNRLAAGSTLAGVLCFAVCFVITVRGHFPLNAQIMEWSVTAPPDGWSDLAGRWRDLHDLRTLFAVVGYGLLLLGVAIPVGRRGGSARKMVGPK
jgi:hypothetical protein